MLIRSGLALDLIKKIQLRLTWRGDSRGSLMMEAVGSGSHCGGCW